MRGNTETLGQIMWGSKEGGKWGLMDGLTGDISLHNQSVDSSFPANQHGPASIVKSDKIKDITKNP